MTLIKFWVFVKHFISKCCFKLLVLLLFSSPAKCLLCCLRRLGASHCSGRCWCPQGAVLEPLEFFVHWFVVRCYSDFFLVSSLWFSSINNDGSKSNILIPRETWNLFVSHIEMCTCSSVLRQQNTAAQVITGAKRHDHITAWIDLRNNSHSSPLKPCPWAFFLCFCWPDLIIDAW